MKLLPHFFLLMLFPLATLAVPNYINYQGHLLDASSIPVGYPTAVNLSMVISIWDSPTSTLAANKKYEETQTVNVNDGVYNFQIGAGAPSAGFSWNPTSLFNTSAPRYVQLTITGNTLTPRHELLSAPFTLQSGNSDNLGGQPIGYFGTASTEAILQGQIDQLKQQVMCSASGNSKWSFNNNFCFGGTPKDCAGLDFTGEKFAGVALTDAICKDAKFANVDFSGADFEGQTDFSNADFTGANVTNVIWGIGVTCPNKYVIQRAGEVCIQKG